MANKQINELSEKSDILMDDDLILVWDSEEGGSEKTKKVPISNYIYTINSSINLYVSTTGNDTTGNGSSGNPWATINKAIVSLSNSHICTDGNVTINVADGTYNSMSTVTIHGAFADRIKVLGNSSNPENVVLNFSAGQHGFGVHNGAYTLLEGLKIMGVSQTAGTFGVLSQFGSTPQVMNCIVDDWHIGAYCLYGGGPYFGGCTFNNNNYGVVSQNSNVSVISCSITNNDISGVQAQWAGRAFVSGSTFSGNTDDTVETAGGTVVVV
jgi:hypothetical protein